MRLKSGTIREDGMIFWGYQSRTRQEYWVLPEKYAYSLEKRRASQAAWRKANPEKQRALSAAWSKANPEKTRMSNARRRALKSDALSPDANKAFVTGLYAIANRVSKCLGISHDVDHIVPLSLGGSHCHRNLQVIPATWNYRKHDRYDYPLPDCYRTDGWMIL